MKLKNIKIGKPYSEGFLRPRKNNCISVFACLNTKSSLIPVKKDIQTPSQKINKCKKKKNYKHQAKVKFKNKKFPVFSKVSEVRIKLVFGPGDILSKVPLTDFWW